MSQVRQNHDMHYSTPLAFLFTRSFFRIGGGRLLKLQHENVVLQDKDMYRLAKALKNIVIHRQRAVAHMTYSLPYSLAHFSDSMDRLFG